MQRSRMLWVSVSIVSLLLAGFVALSSAVAATDCHLITHLGDPAPECATVVPAATALPLIAANTTNVPLAHIAIPPIAGKTGSFDILDIDQQAHLLYVADRTDTGVDIFDVSTPSAKYVRTVDVGAGANGLTVAKNVSKLFVANNNSEIAIIDINPSSTTYDTVLANRIRGARSGRTRWITTRRRRSSTSPIATTSLSR